MTKGFNFSRGSHVDATWHSGPRGSATRAHAAYIYFYILHIIYSKGIQPSIYRKGIQPLKPMFLINPSMFFNFFPCGTKVPHSFKMQVTWPLEVRWIVRSAEYRASIA